MCKYINMAMERLQDFSILDVGIFKLALISFGILLGILLGEKGKKLAPIFWFTFLTSYCYLIFILFFRKDVWIDTDDFDNFDDLEEYMSN